MVRTITFSLLFAATAIGAPQGVPTTADANARPNVIVLVADDLGSSDLSLSGATDFVTPNLDALARSGTRCTAAYVTAPVCAPSRAALLTGRYQQRFGFEFNQGPPPAAAQNFGLPAEETTLAERMRAAGYATGMVGKWHLGELPGQRPTERGFDEFFGFLDNASQYDPMRRREATSPIFRGMALVKEKEWLTRAFARESTAFVDRHAQHPFFLYVAYSAAHNPLQSDPAIAPRVAAIEDERRRDYANLVLGLDDAVGALMAKLAEKGLDGNTLVVFVSDNGAIQRRSNGSLSGGKTSLWEGGIRVPMVVRFKGHVPEGQVFDAPVSTLDIVPTVLAAAGVASSPDWKLDGVDLVPVLGGVRRDVPHPALFWRMGTRWAVRQGDWKLVAPTADAATSLFHLTQDPGERTDLSAEQPEIAKELRAAWERWDATNVAPRWPGKEDFEEPPMRRKRERRDDGG